ncbi:hypothetical protein GWK47_000787 [Chionoecetes opilio]|uniref:Uncharacterized protein n=1 Tax=Chionoecetes opilio TaxID=41210 RepID=A0A8J5CQV0_CHIOP|nr:hypothetical protein GWK47_000787 [Chionoecetes opilio]
MPSQMAENIFQDVNLSAKTAQGPLLLTQRRKNWPPAPASRYCSVVLTRRDVNTLDEAAVVPKDARVLPHEMARRLTEVLAEPEVVRSLTQNPASFK